MKKLFKDFRDFITRGNAIDLAIGIIIGAAFTSVVNSIVNNLIMPPFGVILSNVDFQDLFIVLRHAEAPLTPGSTLQMARDMGTVTLNYGLFITDLISFLILAMGVFLIIRGIQKMEKNAEKVKGLFAAGEKETDVDEPTKKNCPFCLTEIPVKAIRCPFCTSHLEELTGVEGA